MSEGSRPRAPSGELSSYARTDFSHAGATRVVYTKGLGPAVIVITELPGITPRVLGFADRIAALGCSVILPDLFGTAGRDPYAKGLRGARLYSLSSCLAVCVSREFNLLAAGRSSPVVDWLQALAAREHARCGGPGVGVVGMCFTGGFALAMAGSAAVLAPVLSQPSLPLAFTKRQAAAIDCSGATLNRVAERCARDGLRVLGLRFLNDPLVPAARFDMLRERLGDGFVAVELEQTTGHPDGPMPHRHCVLTEDLVDASGEPTYAALQQVLDPFREKLLHAH